MAEIEAMEELKRKYPGKVCHPDEAFAGIRPGDRIFISTACGEPQFLVASLVDYVTTHPKAFFDAEILHVWTLGLSPYSDEKLRSNFRHNSFFIGRHTRQAVNEGGADYTPIFLSEVPALFRSRQVPVDVALVQVSPPDSRGYCSLGISLDIGLAAVEKAGLVIAQVNKHMPRVHGDTFIHVSALDHCVFHDEPLLEYRPREVDPDVAGEIGRYVARIVEDGDTVQIGYGSLPDRILASLEEKKHLGIHSELIGDGVVDLLEKGVIDNSRKSRNRGKVVASFCMGTSGTYAYLDDNPTFLFKEIDYTNNGLVIAAHEQMTAINSALIIDLTGQSTAESLGSTFYSGMGGQANFMRGAVMAPRGKNILVLQSTTRDTNLSRIVPALPEGTGVTLTRGDIHYVVTEQGIAYLHGKNIRERAMALIAIAHPKFREWLIEEARARNLIYRDQAFIPGEAGHYPAHLETYRTTTEGMSVLLRPVRISDEGIIRDFYYDLSDKTIHRRFLTIRRHLPRAELQENYLVIDYTREMVILAVTQEGEREEVAGMAQYCTGEGDLTAEISVVVRDAYQGRGLGFELLSYLVTLAKNAGMQTLTADILPDNLAVFRLLERLDLPLERHWDSGLINVVIRLK